MLNLKDTHGIETFGYNEVKQEAMKMIERDGKVLFKGQENCSKL